MERKIKRGDIYYADLNPVVGSEQGGTRPVLIISNDVGNKYSPTVIIAAITSKKRKETLPMHYVIGDVDGLPAESVVLMEQIRTIDKTRLREWIVQLDGITMDAILTPLLISIGVKINRQQTERGH